MVTFEEKLEEFSIIFSKLLKKFNDETFPRTPEVISGQICLAGEFKNNEVNIKEAS